MTLDLYPPPPHGAGLGCPLPGGGRMETLGLRPTLAWLPALRPAALPTPSPGCDGVGARGLGSPLPLALGWGGATEAVSPLPAPAPAASITPVSHGPNSASVASMPWALRGWCPKMGVGGLWQDLGAGEVSCPGARAS